ncbi:hypothetical protein CPB85DRAFT_1433776 [Mucidula mucida]|nr:hypothetical protein CPB85DRAFT_1433776 [Mucidula mucida]
MATNFAANQAFVVLHLVDGQVVQAPVEKSELPSLKPHDFSTGIKSSQPTASPPMRISSESGWAHDLCSCGDHTGTCLTAT